MCKRERGLHLGVGKKGVAKHDAEDSIHQTQMLQMPDMETAYNLASTTYIQLSIYLTKTTKSEK